MSVALHFQMVLHYSRAKLIEFDDCSEVPAPSCGVGRFCSVTQYLFNRCFVRQVECPPALCWQRSSLRLRVASDRTNHRHQRDRAAGLENTTATTSWCSNDLTSWPVPLRCSIHHDDGRTWVTGFPGLPVRHERGKHLEFSTFQRSLHRGTKQMAPETLRFFVDHYQASLPQHPRHAKVESLSRDISGIHDAIVA